MLYEPTSVDGYKNQNITMVATNLLQSECSDEELIEEALPLLEFIKSVYPKDYKVYIECDFKEISVNNIKDVLRKVVTMNTYNSL